MEGVHRDREGGGPPPHRHRLAHPPLCGRGTTGPSPPRYWRPALEMPPPPEGRPLEGVRIAIDPGHLGGDFAELEERWFQFGDGRPVTEGDLTLQVATLLEPRLTALGAEVTLVRSAPGPVARPERAPALAIRPGQTAGRHPGGGPPAFPSASSTGRPRSASVPRRVNEEIQPDLVLCLHFNAEAWGDPNAPDLLEPQPLPHHPERGLHPRRGRSSRRTLPDAPQDPAAHPPRGAGGERGGGGRHGGGVLPPTLSLPLRCERPADRPQRLSPGRGTCSPTASTSVRWCFSSPM